MANLSLRRNLVSTVRSRLRWNWKKLEYLPFFAPFLPCQQWQSIEKAFARWLLGHLPQFLGNFVPCMSCIPLDPSGQVGRHWRAAPESFGTARDTQSWELHRKSKPPAISTDVNQMWRYVKCISLVSISIVWPSTLQGWSPLLLWSPGFALSVPPVTEDFATVAAGQSLLGLSWKPWHQEWRKGINRAFKSKFRFSRFEI